MSKPCLISQTTSAAGRRRFRRQLAFCAAVAFAALGLAVGFSKAVEDTSDKALSPEARALKKADALLQKQHWAEARAVFDEVRDTADDWRLPHVRLAVEGAVACSMHLAQWDDALARAEQYTSKTKGSFEEAVGHRFLAGLYLQVPHEGTKRGSEYLRGQYTQGVRVSSWRKDRRMAIAHYERAREILAELAKTLGSKDNPDTPERRALIAAERIGVNFDLAAAIARRDAYGGYGPYGWLGWWWGGAFEAEEESEAVEEADYEEPRWARWRAYDQTPPTGIPLGPDGKPRFIELPKEYSSSLGDGPKIRYLLDEIQRLDESPKKDEAARALYRWAMIARSLYGPETAQYYPLDLPDGSDGSDKSDRPSRKIWDLDDDEALTLVGGRLRVVVLPGAESPISLLRLLEEKYPESSLRPEAHYARALYYQTRQQFPQALAEYRDLIQRYPDHPRAQAATTQIELIERPEVLLSQGAVYLPETKPRLAFTYRNTDKIQFKAYAFDLAKYVLDRMDDKSENYWNYRDLNWGLFHRQLKNEKEPWRKYLRDEVAAWTESVKEEGNRVAEAATLAPLETPGAFIIEAGPAGAASKTRCLILVTDIAIVQKNLVKKGLIYIADARTGQPLADKAVRVYEHWQVYDQKKRRPDLYVEVSVLATNQDGVIEYTRKHPNQGSLVDAVVLGDDNRMAFSFFQNWYEHDRGREGIEEGERYYVITDRPVYRPNDVVKFRVWSRRLQNRAYVPVANPNESLSIAIYDAKNNEAKSFSSRVDAFGCVSGEFELGDEPPLGLYHIRVNGRLPDVRRNAGALFRVEEYKKPEFEVEVKPARTQARLGEKVQAQITARYYFGAPVARGHVAYKVFRENYRHVYWGPGEYDWLYGKGYGRYYYAYPWLPWWGRWGCFVLCDIRPAYSWVNPVQFPWGGYYGDEAERWQRHAESGTRTALRELVAQGEGELKEDGTYEVEFDTARTKLELGDRDHRYTIEAEVRDESRRTIEGKGSIIVTRREFYAFVEADAGWYQPRNEAFIEVRTLTPDNVPVSCKGEVIIARIRYSDADRNEVQEEIVRRWEAETDAQGRLSFRYAIPGEGQYRVTFKTQDSWKEEVQGNAVFWVCGPKFDGRIYRFNDLEIIADKRTYKVGETAHLLINVAENNSRLLFSDNVSRGVLLDYRFLDIPSRSIVVDIPILEKHVPNFYVEATLVRNGRVHMESRELFVPPVKGMLEVKVETDRATYKPGDTGKVKVTLTDASGEPASGQVTLTAYDEAVTYIQNEFGPNPRVFFYGQKRYHTPQKTSSLDHRFGVWGSLQRAEHFTHPGGEPEGWRGFWNIAADGLSLSGGLEGEDKKDRDSFYFDRLSGVAGERSARRLVTRGAAREMIAADGALPMSAEPAAAAPMAARARGEIADASAFGGGMAKGFEAQPPGPGGMVEPEIRTHFADTALWIPALRVGDNGTTETEIVFPQSLTTWRIRAYGLTHATQVGDATANVTTTKNLLVRLQAPRFFVERDEVVLSANVHNYLKADKKVSAELIIPADLLEFMSDAPAGVVKDKDGNAHFAAAATVAANGEHRFDWPVKVKKQGLARITVKALTDEESDAMRMAFPVFVHGINKTVAQSGSFRVAEDGDRVLTVELPADVDPEQTQLEIMLSPSLAGVMIDALPYLVGYPYGCVEQTMSRFYPTVLVADILKRTGTNLEAIGTQRKQMTAGDLANRFGRWRDPVFDTDEMNQMVRAGLERIYAFQQNDGGWGWWREDESSPFQTAYVLQGLNAAIKAGIKVDRGVYDRGLDFLQQAIRAELAKPKHKQHLGGLECQAYMAYILSLENRLRQKDQQKWLDDLYTSRGLMTNYGRSQLALAMHNLKRSEEAQTLLRNVLQFVERDDSNETAWIRTPAHYWWFWWNNDIETNAWALKALVALDPNSDLAPRLVKWLLNNRRNGYYWRSTRDTAHVISAMCDYMIAAGEAAPDYTLTVSVDDRPMKEIKLTKDNFFTFDNRVVLYGLQVKPGKHEIRLAKKGPGALYYSAYLSYFTLEEDIKGAGNEIFVERQYFKLVPRTETVKLPDKGQAATLPAGRPDPLDITGRTEQRAIWTRVPLKTGDAVQSGDKIEVVLTITAKNTYDYLTFEDMKPAGCEPMELRSGGRWAGGLCANLELRDEKVVFFIGLLEQGRHVLRYKMRAETPGKFHALPTKGFAMYAPEVRAISDEMRLGIAE